MPGNIVELPASVLLPDGSERVCRIFCDETDLMRIEPRVAPEGVCLIVHVPHLGILEGLAGHAAGSGQEFRLKGTPSHLARIAARVRWHQRRANGVPDQREHARIVPTDTFVRVQVVPGEPLSGAIIDLSASGAAVRLAARPALGASVTVGRRHAKVVRHLDEGIAVRFNLPLRPQDVVPETVL